MSEIPRWLIALVVFEALAVAATYLFWDEGWQWLMHCDRGPTRYGPHTCTPTNWLVLLVPVTIAFVIAAVLWDRDHRRR